MAPVLVLFAVTFAGSGAVGDVHVAASDVQVLSGTEFRRRLAATTTAAWSEIPLRQVLARLEENRQIAILLDRRVDPSQAITVSFTGETLSAVLTEIAAGVECGVSDTGSTLLIGPVESTAKLRTLVEIRADEIRRAALKLPKGRASALFERKALRWGDLATPADLIRQAADRFDLQIHDAHLVPHDLWARGVIGRANAAEMLSLILNQFDLTFAWEPDGSGIRIRKAPEVVAVEKTYRRSASSVDETAAAWRTRFPGISVRKSGSTLVVRGTVEQHEELASLTDRRPPPGGRSPTAGKVTPIARRTFTLRLSDVPVSVLMQKLEESGIRFVYDRDQLEAAGVSLEKTISMDVKEARHGEFFDAMFKDVGVEWKVSGVEVRLTPTESRN